MINAEFDGEAGLSEYTGAADSRPSCSLKNCNRLANPLDGPGRCKPCADLIWYRSQH